MRWMPRSPCNWCWAWSEPQSSGLGGGAFMLLHDGKAQQLIAYDGRETAPAAAKPDRFMKDGEPMAFHDAVVGGKSVGVPGTVRLLETAHRKHGRMRWAELFAPAIALAEQGFAVSPRLHALLAAERHMTQPRARAYFFGADGKPLPVGTTVAESRLRGNVAQRSPRAAPMRSIAAKSRATSSTRRTPTRPIPATSRWPILPATACRSAQAVCDTYRGYPRLRHAAAVVRRHDRVADAEDARAVRPARDGSGVVLERAFLQRSGTPGLCRPRRLRGGSGFLHAAFRTARRRPICVRDPR